MKRLLSCLLCLTILIGSISYCSPKAKAVSVVGDLALAEAVTAAYLTSTGIELSVTAGGASAVTSGITAAAGEYAAATGAAASGEAFLGTVAAGTAISTAGAIVLTAAAAVAVGAFAYWLYTTYCSDSDGTIYHNAYIVGDNIPFNAVCLSDGSSGSTVYCSVLDDGFTRYDKIVFSSDYYIALTGNFGDDVSICDANGGHSVWRLGSLYDGWVFWLAQSPESMRYDYPFAIVTKKSTNDIGKQYYVHNFVPRSICNKYGIVVESEELSVNGHSYVASPEILDTQQMVIDVGAPAGATLEELAQTIPEQVASNTLNVTYTIVSPDEGTEGDGSEIDPDPVPTEIPSWVPDWFGRIITTIQALPQSIADKFSSILGSIKSSIDALAESIAEGIKNLFEPDPDLVTEITTAFTDKFSWLETVHQFGEDLFGMTAESSPPVIYIHLEDAEGRYIYGGTEKALDLSWYQRYKADVDGILSGFMWIAFLWLVFKRASAIIQGGEMITEYTNDLDEGHRSRRH